MNYRDEKYIAAVVDCIWNPESGNALAGAFDRMAIMRSVFLARHSGVHLQNSLRFMLEVERELMHTARRAGYFN